LGEHTARETSLYGNVRRLEFVEAALGGKRSAEGRGPLTVLDFGCGTGELLSIPLAEHGHHVHGIDSHTESIDAAGSIATSAGDRIRGSVRFSSDSLADLERQGVTYDVIVASEVLEHLHEPETAIQAFRNLLSPGGICVVTVPNGYGPFETLRRMERGFARVGLDRLFAAIPRALVQVVRRLKGKSSGPEGRAHAGYLNFESGHVQFFRRRRLVAMFESFHFTCVQSEGRSFLCGPYVDFWCSVMPMKSAIYDLNSRVSRRLPMFLSSGWMFVFKRTEVQEGG
jgi:SAM-dependent methyltransferase